MENKKISQNLKILYIGPIPAGVEGPWPCGGGESTYTWELINQSKKNGYEVYLWINIPHSFTINDIKIIETPSKNKLLKAFYGLYYYFKYRKNTKHLNFLKFKQKISLLYRTHLLNNILKVINPDIIHILSLLDIISLSFNILHYSKPIIATDHGVGVIEKYKLHKIYYIKNKKYLSEMIREVSNIFDYIISVSEFAKNLLVNEFNLNESKKVKSIINPINEERLSILNRKEIKKKLKLSNKKIVFFSGVSKPIKKKGLDILLKSFDYSSYLRKNCILLVITEEKAVTFAKDFLNEKKINGIILEPQHWDRLVEYYNISDVFVMPSRTEGIGLVYEEALSFGIPIIGFPESVKEIENLLGIYIGERFDPYHENEMDLENKIKKVLNTKFDKKELRRKSIEKLSWNNNFFKYDNIYKEVLKNKE